MDKLTSRASAAPRAFGVVALLLAAALALGGCGGSKGSGSPLGAVDAGRGSLSVTIQWPQAGRAIPAQTKSVVVTVVGGGTTAQTANRTGSETSVTLRFNDLAPGDKVVVADAFDDLNGAGSKVASGQASVTVQNDTLATASITMAELTDVDKLVAEGQKLINEVIDMKPFDPVQAKLKIEQAKLKFEAAVAADPNHAQANFGLAITKAAVTAQALADKYAPVFATRTRSRGGSAFSLDGLTFWQMPQAIANGTDPVRSIVPTMGATVGLVMSGTRSAAVQDVLNMQTDLKNTVLPMISEVLGYLDKTEKSAAFTFALGTFGSRDYVLVDVGDVFIFDGVLRGVKACVALPASYNLDYGSWDLSVHLDQRDANGDGIITRAEYLPPDPFGTLADPAPMRAIKADIQTACDKIIAGVDATLAETRDEFDLIAWHTPGAGPTQQDLVDFRAVVTEVKLAAAGPTLLPFPMGDFLPGVIKVDITAWSDNPPASLKAFAPEWELVPSGGHTDTRVKKGSIADTTFGGLFPDGLPDDLLYQPETGNVDVTIK